MEEEKTFFKSVTLYQLQTLAWLKTIQLSNAKILSKLNGTSVNEELNLITEEYNKIFKALSEKHNPKDES